MTERDIVYQAGSFWVARYPDRYTVYRNGHTHARADSSYPRTADGLSVATARAAYLAGRASGTEYRYVPVPGVQV